MGSLPALVPVWACQQFLALPPWALLLVQALLVDGIQVSWIPHLCGFPCPHSRGQLWSCCWIRAGRSQQKNNCKTNCKLEKPGGPSFRLAKCPSALPLLVSSLGPPAPVEKNTGHANWNNCFQTGLAGLAGGKPLTEMKK